MKKRIVGLVLLLCMLVSTCSYASAEMRIKILYGKDELICDVAPMMVNDRTMVPLRAIFEAIGAAVGYEEDTQRITAIKGDTTVILRVGDNVMYVDGKEEQLDSPAFVVNGRTLVPLRACAESFGLEVEWWEDARIVKIKKGAWLLTETVYADATKDTYIYDARGNLLESQSYSGWTQRSTYDERDNLLTHEAYSYTYDVYGNQVRMESYGIVKEYTYNDNRQIVTEKGYNKMSPIPTEYIYTYDNFGVLVRKESADGTYWETRTVDANGNVLRYEDSGGRWNSAVYDANGRLLETEDSLMPGKNTYEYDENGNLIRMNRMDGMTETYEYDEDGRLVLIQTNNDYYVQYTYDAEGRKASTVTPSGTESYIYDAHGNLIETVHADGTKTTCKYEYYVL